jgi:SAM-dependent methyltransferase
MGEADYFGEASVIDAMTAEHRILWRTLFVACGPRIRSGIRVLDFGCGNGGMLAYLMLGDGRKWPGCRYALGMGIDRPELHAVLAEAGDRLGRKLPVVFTSAAPRSFPGQFDIVLSHEVIYLVPDLVETFQGLRASLRPGGVIALATGCHSENSLYPRWTEALARVGVRALPYGIPDYLRALRDAGFEDVGSARMRMEVDDYEEWLKARGDPEPNPEWFSTSEEERRYYTEFGKTLITARRALAEEPSSVPPREGP